jgi:hypothetical protein
MYCLCFPCLSSGLEIGGGLDFKCGRTGGGGDGGSWTGTAAETGGSVGE